MAATYEYTPLIAPRTIRLLELRPGKDTDPVQVSLITTPLNSAPAFEALSYCWGDPSDRRELLCNGCILPIPTSLFTGLEHFRPRPLSHSDSNGDGDCDSAPSRVLWADAICINQSDLAERSAQVQLMPSIYSLARRVLIWLGPLSPPYSGAAVRSCIREVAAVVPAINDHDSAELRSKAAQAVWREAKLRNMDFLPLVSLLGRPWFRRRWVVQEVSLAREAVICVGRVGENMKGSEKDDEEIPWMEVAALSQRLEGVYFERFVRERVSRGEMPSSNMEKMEISLHCLAAMYSVSLYRFKGTLMDCINATAHFECSDPRDIIYSLLGLGFVGPTMTPNYAVDFLEVFWEFALAMIVEGASLKVLSLAPEKPLPSSPVVERPKGLPSWVPDLRRAHADALSAYSVMPETFLAGGHGKPIVCVSGDRRVLSCQGRLVDTAKQFATDLDEVFRLDPKLVGHLDQALAAWFRGCYQILLGESGGDVPSAETMKAFSRTIVCDVDSMRNRLSPESAASLPSYMQRLIDDVEQENGNFEADDARFAWEHLLSHSVSATMTMQALARIFKFGVTDSGRFMRASCASQAGDRICVLVGGEVPFIIRPTGRDSYKLVGECYVHGIMDGEALEIESGATAQYETICLE